MERYMTGDEIRQMARKYHNPTDRINEDGIPSILLSVERLLGRQQKKV